MRLYDPGFKIVRDNNLRGAPKKLESTHMRIDEVSLILAPCRFSVGVIGRAPGGNKQLCGPDLAGIRIDNIHRWATVIDEQLLPCFMLLAHGRFLDLLPSKVAMAVLGIAVTILWMMLPVFLPQQELGDQG